MRRGMRYFCFPQFRIPVHSNSDTWLQAVKLITFLWQKRNRHDRNALFEQGPRVADTRLAVDRALGNEASGENLRASSAKLVPTSSACSKSRFRKALIIARVSRSRWSRSATFVCACGCGCAGGLARFAAPPARDCRRHDGFCHLRRLAKRA